MGLFFSGQIRERLACEASIAGVRGLNEIQESLRAKICQPTAVRRVSIEKREWDTAAVGTRWRAGPSGADGNPLNPGSDAPAGSDAEYQPLRVSRLAGILEEDILDLGISINTYCDSVAVAAPAAGTDSRIT